MMMMMMMMIIRSEIMMEWCRGCGRYGGPDSQLVTDEFKIEWLTYLTSSENVIFAQVDGRGSGGRGITFLHRIYRRFGTIEVQDQLTAAR